MKFLAKALFPLLLIILAACGPKQDADTPVYREIADLYGAVFGINTFNLTDGAVKCTADNDYFITHCQRTRRQNR